MKSDTAKKLVVFGIALVLFVLVVSATFQTANLNLKQYAPYNVNIDSTTNKKQFITWLSPLAKAIGGQYGLPWQGIVSHVALETAWGKSQNFQKHFNFGGIKSKAGQESVSLPTQEFINGKYISTVDGFAVFKTPYLGIKGYADFLKNNPRYSKAFGHKNDPGQFLKEVSAAGWATDPDYTSKLLSILQSNFS